MLDYSIGALDSTGAAGSAGVGSVTTVCVSLATATLLGSCAGARTGSMV